VIFTAVATFASLSLPAAVLAQTATVVIGQTANQLSVSMYSDSVVVALSGPDPEGGGVASARLSATVPDARTWATAVLASISSCRADRTRQQHATTLYDHGARNDAGEARFPNAILACGRGRRGELATIDVAKTRNFATSLLFASYSEAQAYFKKVVKALPPSSLAHSEP
jgi:hypothetical protein